jgi:putative transposase
MSVFSLTIGLVVRRGERSWRLERHLEDGTLVFADQVTARPMTLTVAELWRELQCKRLSLVCGDPPVGSASRRLPLVFDAQSLKPPQRQKFEYRVKVIMVLRQAGVSRGQRRAIQAALDRAVTSGELPAAPSTSAAMSWMRALDEAQGATHALVAGHAFRRLSPRLPNTVLEAARAFLRQHYCTRARPSLAQTHLLLTRDLAQRSVRGEIPAEHATISRSTLRRLKEEISPYDRDHARLGLAYTRNKWRYSLRGTDLGRAMQCYEIDHTVIDVVVVSDSTGLPLGRPTITVVVDAFSGCVVGFYVSFMGPGLGPALGALKIAISPKASLTQGAHLELAWLGYGTPELLRVDNGLEFHSPQFSSVAFHLAMDLQYCAVRQPWLKPVVERVLGSYIQYLPAAGRVRRALPNELPVDPRGTAAITFSALCLGLLQAFVDVHPQQINPRRLSRPYDLFRDGLEELPPPALVLPSDELDIVVAPSRDLTVGQGGGIETQYLRYNSPQLQALRREVGANFRTSVKFNPENLGGVYVQHPRAKGWLQVPCTRPEYAEGLSIVQHRAIRALAKEELSRRGADEALARAKLRLIDHWADHTKKGQKLVKEHLRAMAALTSSHVLAGPVPPTLHAPRLVTTEDTQPAPPLDIPEFEAFQL